MFILQNMMQRGFMPHYYQVAGFGIITQILIIILVIVVIWWVMKGIHKGPEEILKERLAKGEITSEEYKNLKKEINGK